MATALVYSMSCSHSTPDVTKIVCANDNDCPSEYRCATPGQAGGCKMVARNLDASSNDVVLGADTTTPNDADGSSFRYDGSLADAGSDQQTANADLGTVTLPDSRTISPDGPPAGDSPRSEVPPEVSDGSSSDSGDGTGGPDGFGETGASGADASRDGGAGPVDAGSDATDQWDGTAFWPEGYWLAGDWGLAGKTWAGCVWTQVDSIAGTSSTITPSDFTSHQPWDPYQVSGKTSADFDAFAMLGFNLNEPITGDPNQCSHRIFDQNARWPAGVPLAGIYNSLWVQWTGAGQTAFRVLLIGPNGWSDPNERWCANNSSPSPSAFPFKNFHTKCWMADQGGDQGNAYNGELISSVVFLIRGAPTPQPFDFTIGAFTVGNATL